MGEWWVRPLQNEVDNGEECIHLEARSIEVLQCLAKNAPSVVSKETILSEVWGDIAVGDEVVSHAIWELRKSFGDDARRQDYIRTIPKKGYALVAEVFWSVQGEPQIGTSVGPYRLEEEIGRGAMGVVYRAVDSRLRRSVALKFLASELTRDVDAVRRFEREARLAASLDHPNLAPIFEVGEMSGGRQFLVTAYCSGGTLRDRLKKNMLNPREALEIAAQVARGLAVAHRKDIVHRDVKPGNILLTEDGNARLVDFGIAKLTSSTSLTRTGHSLGTPAYKSPEQSRGDPTDHRTDIWSLGVVLYECLTGKRPFTGSFEHAVVRSILEDDPDLTLSSLPTDRALPGLEAILRKALAKEPADRYQSADRLADDLESCLGRAPRRRYAAAGRRPWLVAGVLLAIGAALGVWVATWSDRQLREDREAEVRQLLDEGWELRLAGFKEEGTERARDRFTTAYIRSPWNPEVLGSLAYSLTLGLGDTAERETARAEARDLVRRARSEGLDHGLLRVAAARLEMYDVWALPPPKRDYSKAVSLATRAIESFSKDDPNLDLAYLSLGRAYERADRLDEARSAYEEATRWGHGAIRGREGLAYFLWQVMKDPEGAASLYNAILREDEDHLSALVNLGKLYVDVGRPEDAAANLRRAFELREDALVANTLGVAYFYQDGKAEEACKYFRRSTELAPTYAHAFNGLGDCRFVQDELEDAEENWRIALELYEATLEESLPADQRVRYQGLRAVVLAKLGECDRALAVEEMALESSPDSAPAAEVPETRLHRAQVYALCGEPADVYDLVRDAAAQNYPRRIFKTDPCFSKFQGDPKFEAALEGQ